MPNENLFAGVIFFVIGAYMIYIGWKGKTESNKTFFWGIIGAGVVFIVLSFGFAYAGLK
jgi:hypothetical protein